MSEKIRFELEFTFSTSQKVLFNRLATPSGLSEWFAESVEVIDNIFIFTWGKSKQSAEIIGIKPNSWIRFKWEEDEEDYFFEFKIIKDELTNELALIITDFADDESDKIENIELWESQISDLKRVIGL